MCTGFLWGNLRGKDYLEEQSVDGRIILNGSSRSEMGAWTALILLRIGTGGGFL
jgi:hypothetical protein